MPSKTPRTARPAPAGTKPSTNAGASALPAAALAPALTNPLITPLTKAQATRLATRAAAAWQQGDAAALAASCATLTAAELQRWPDLARWRGLLGLLREDVEALACLELAHAGHSAAHDNSAAAVDSAIALALCLCDIGAMEEVNTWLARADAAPLRAAPEDTSPWALWWHLGQVAQVVLQPASTAGATAATVAARSDRASLAWLHRLWAPLAPQRPAHEQLLVASVLVNAQFARQQYEQFDLLAGTVGSPAVLGSAADLPAARWLYTLGFAYYQVGRHDAAHDSWQAGLQRAQATPAQPLPQIGTLLGLASLRLLLDQGRLAQAHKLQASLATAWGPGRPAQRVELAQMRARLALLQGQASAAEAALTEALALAQQAGFSAAELGSCQTDQAQVWLALGRHTEALALLHHLAQTSAGRDATIFKCLHRLVQALQRAPVVDSTTGTGSDRPNTSRVGTDSASRSALAEGLALAAQLRYTMFFRLLPAWAAQVCALALQAGVEPVFAADVVRQRALPAPPGAGRHWPWPLWLRLLGGFELRLHGQTQARQPKPQAKPLELLRLLACSPGMGLALGQAADALWPDADGAAAQNALETTLHRLRKLLGDAPLLTQSEGHLQLDPQRVCSDLRLRDSLTQDWADQALAPRGSAAGADALSASLREWLALAAPDTVLLPGAPDAPWLLQRRQQMARDGRRASRAMAALIVRAQAQAAADTVALQALETSRAQAFAGLDDA